MVVEVVVDGGPQTKLRGSYTPILVMVVDFAG